MVALGSAAPDFQLSDLQGREITLAAQRGRVVFVNFWATWCPPCRDEAPSLQRLYDQLGSENFEILAVSIDAPSAQGEVAEFSREFGLTFPVLLDPNKDAHRAYGVTGVPETYMIDPQGRLVERFIGPRDWDDPRYVRTVRRLQQAGVEVAMP
jgi:peroxiredoxin